MRKKIKDSLKKVIRRNALVFNFYSAIYRSTHALKVEYGWGALPKLVMIEPTNVCNFSCAMCPHKIMKRKKGFMELELFKLVLDRVKEAGVPHIILHTVGEPLMHPKFLEMLRLSAQCSCVKKVEFYTNGSLLNEACMEEVLHMKMCTVHLSFGGWDKESYEKRYCGGVFEGMVAIIKTFNRMIQAHQAPSRTLIVEGLADEEWQKEKTIEFLKSIGLERSQINILYPFHWIDFIADSYSRNVDKCDNIPIKPRACYLMRDNPGIFHDGTVTACGCHDINGELFIGDIRKQGISDIRKGPFFKNIARKLKSGDLRDVVCHRCDGVVRH